MEVAVTEALISDQGLAERLAAALRGDEFVLYGQVIRPLSTGASQRPFDEILIRFREEETRLLPPGSFLPILEECGLMPQVDRWVVAHLARRVTSARAVKPDWQVPRHSINLSAATLYDSRFAEYVIWHVGRAQLPQESLVFEVPWSAAAGHAAPLSILAAQLKGAGCRLAIGGFEGANSDFELLKLLTPDFVKLSLRLTRNVDRSRADLALLDAINQACAELGIQTIAEHVESDAVLAQLIKLGIDFAQGFGIDPPRPLL
jgi:EAL domain-containing protein (putative c-di-GMP-specific phosphodiesterase class I)